MGRGGAGRGRNATFIFWSLFFFNAGLGLYLSIWPNYLRRLGAGTAEIALVGFAGFAATTLAVIPGGFLADRLSHKGLMLAGWWMCLPVPPLFALAARWWAVIPGVVLLNLSNVCLPALMVYLARQSSEDELAHTYTWVFASGPLGLLFTPLLGGIVAERAGMPAVFWATGVLFLVSTLLLYPLTEDQPAATVRDGGCPPSGPWLRPLLAPLGLGLLLAIVLGLAPPFLPVFLEEAKGMTLALLGLAGSFAAFGGVFFSAILGRMAKGAGTTRAMAAGGVCLAAAFPLLLYGGSPGCFFGGYLLRGAGDGLRSLGSAFFVSRMRAEGGGRLYGIYSLVTGLGGAAAPLLGGLAFSRGAGLLFLGNAAGCIALAALALACGPRRITV
ncbi:MAG: MFS transporter [Patescibacteria group bacterium]